jgi:hypothetical protein
MASTEDSPKLQSAPRWRQTLAGLINAATIGAVSVLHTRWQRRSRDAGSRPGASGERRWPRLLSLATVVLDQQVGTPGGWIMGLRTVDSRTGRRLALWRSLALALAGAGIQELRRRAFGVRKPLAVGERADLAHQLETIKDTHRDDPDGRQRETMRAFSERQVDVKYMGWRVLAGVVGATFVNHRLRRRLAPTTVVARERRQPHSPYERPITSSMISSVPAPMRFRRASRHTRSTPYSFM